MNNPTPTREQSTVGTRILLVISAFSALISIVIVVAAVLSISPGNGLLADEGLLVMGSVAGANLVLWGVIRSILYVCTPNVRKTRQLKASLCFALSPNILVIGLFVTGLGVSLVPITKARKAKAPQALHNTTERLEQPAPGGLNGSDPTVLREVYQSSGPLSQSDVELLTKFETLGGAWNRETAPLIRDYMAPDVTREQWVENSKAYLVKARQVFLEQQAVVAMLSDTGAKETLQPVIDVHKDMLDLYQMLQNAMVDGNSEVVGSLLNALRSQGLKKQQIATPIIQRMRSRLGRDVDFSIQKVAEEIASDVSPK